MNKTKTPKQEVMERIYPKIQEKMDILDWSNLKISLIRTINGAKASIETNMHMLAYANVKIKEALR